MSKTIFCVFLFTIIICCSSFAQSNLGTKKMSHHENKSWFEPVPKSVKKIIACRSFLRNGDTIRDKSLELIYDTNGNLIEKRDSLTFFVMKYKYDTLNRLIESKMSGILEEDKPNAISTYSYFSNDILIKNKEISSDTIIITKNEYNKKKWLMCSKTYHSREANSTMDFLISYQYDFEKANEKSLYFEMPKRKLLSTVENQYIKHKEFSEDISPIRTRFGDINRPLLEKKEYNFYKEGVNKGKLQSISIFTEYKHAESRIYEENYSYPSENTILVSFKQNGTQIYKYQFIYQDEKLIRVNYYSIIEPDKIDKWIEYEYIF